MRSRLARVLKRVLIITIVAIALVCGLGFLAEHFVRQRLDEFVKNSCATIDSRKEPRIDVSILERSVSIHHLHLLPVAGCADARIALHGAIDTLEIGGISLSDLFFHERLRAAYLRTGTQGLSIVLRKDTVPADSVVEAGARTSATFGTMRVRSTGTSLVTMSDDTIRFGEDVLLLSAKDFHFQNDIDSGARVTTSEDLRLVSKGLYAYTSTGYALTLERCELDQEARLLNFFGAHVQPVKCTEEHSATMDLERDVFDARLDTLRIEELNMDELLARRTLIARGMHLHGGDVTVLRDKTLPDENWRHKPLLARLLRWFPEGTAVDTIMVTALDVRYRERADRERGYSLIPFSNINATITGARNLRGDTSALVLDAHCSSFSDTPVILRLSTVIQDTTDRMEVDASIGRLPFSALRRATGPLVGVQATEGVMDSLIYRMTGNDQRASGSVRMTYSGLKLESGWKERRQALNEVGTVLLNALVRDKGRDRDGTLRVGEFSIERRRDRAVFNYLWSGLREGSKAVILPEVITGNGRK